MARLSWPSPATCDELIILVALLTLGGVLVASMPVWLLIAMLVLLVPLLLFAKYSHHWLPLSDRAVVTYGTCDHARALHLDRIALLVAESFPEHNAHGELAQVDEDGNDIVDTLVGFHDEARCRWLFCSLDDEQSPVVGLALCVLYHDAIYVSSLCVAPELRGRGLGSHIMRTISALGIAEGLRKVTGSVDAKAQHLIQLYTRLGGTVRPPAPMSDGAESRHERLDAPTGIVTSFGVELPRRLPPLSESQRRRWRESRTSGSSKARATSDPSRRVAARLVERVKRECARRGIDADM